MVMPWLMWILIAVLLATTAIGWTRGKNLRQRVSAVPVAHTAEARRSARFRSRLAWYRTALSIAVVLLLAIGTLAAVIAGRPRAVVEMESKLATRDIVLCLDTSGSVIEFDGEVLKSFETLLDGFDGERISLVIFNAGARTVFPLTDDYDMVREQLDIAQEALAVTDSFGGLYPKNEREYLSFVAGTEAGMQYGSSMIGDGLAACTFGFDLKDKERSRNIIFATDNELAGTPIFSIDEAAKLAADKEIIVHGLYIRGHLALSEYEEEMQTAIEENGGHHYSADDPDAASQIIADVQSQDKKDLGVEDETADTDRPGSLPIWLGLFTLGFVGLAWRFKL